MEEAKKPKRPRIGSAGMNASSDTGENEARYEKVSYPSDSMRTNSGESSEDRNHGNFQKRN
ncbi:MAG: hypothetical protein K2H76_08425, partial [Muribaculaceae bacterium]|nr:hypothetical protein [Muribaculaceae bacterium]